MGGILSLLCVCHFFMYGKLVMDFSAGALPIGVKFCTAVRPHLGQISHFAGIAPWMAEFWVSTGGRMVGYASC